MKQSKPTNIPAKVMDDIKSGRHKMRPKWHFAAVSVLLAFGLTALAISSVFLVNVVFYEMRQNTGPQWFVAAGGLACLAGAAWLMRRYDFSYKVRRLAWLAAILAITLGLGYALARTNINQQLENKGPFERLYQHRVQQKGQEKGPGQAGPRSGTGSQGNVKNNYQLNKP